MSADTDTREGRINDVLDDVARFVAASRRLIAAGEWTDARRITKAALDELHSAHILIALAESQE